jgi:hypothetical protein
MEAQRTGKARTNALKRGEFEVRVERSTPASPTDVYDVLADLRSHAIWGGEWAKEKMRLVQVDAPEGAATVGVEFTTVGVDLMGRFDDRSVVTEATRPSVFEFVTEAVLTAKREATSEWTLIHRYELSPSHGGTRIDYTSRVTRISNLIGPMRLFDVPVLSWFALKGAASAERRGIKNLVRLAEERSGR